MKFSSLGSFYKDFLLFPLWYANLHLNLHFTWFSYMYSLFLTCLGSSQTLLKSLKTLESPLDCKEIQPVHLKGNQSWIFIGRTDVEAETPIVWPPDTKNWLIRKNPDAGKDWRWEEKGMTEDEMVGWHYRLNGYEFE